MTTLTLYQALDTFRDNIDDILHATATNLTHDMNATIDDSKQLGTGTLADDVRKLSIEHRHGDAQRRLKTIARYHKSLRVPPRQGQITEADKDRARATPIETMYPGKLQKRGKELWGLCPFHTEKTPSFSINTTKNVYYCHGCSAGGDAISFWMKTRNVPFITAIRDLAR